MADGTYHSMLLGKALSSGQSAGMNFIWQDDNSTSNLAFGHYGDSVINGVGLIIQKGGNIGIGTNAPDGQLHVFESATTHGINAAADNLIIEGTGVIGMTFASDADMSIAFSDNDASENLSLIHI